MPLQAFDQICPDIARAEMRMCDVPVGLPGVPGGAYFLREYYCNELGCDCRRVLVQFLAADGDGSVAASINYGWEKAAYYRKWSSVPDLWREMAGATLERFAEQGPHARKFLTVFNQIVRNPELVTAFRRHYRLTKEAIEPPPIPEL